MSTRKSAAVSQMVEELQARLQSLTTIPGDGTSPNNLYVDASVVVVMMPAKLLSLHKATRKLEIDLTAAKAEVNYWKQLYSTQQVKK